MDTLQKQLEKTLRTMASRTIVARGRHIYSMHAVKDVRITHSDEDGSVVDVRAHIHGSKSAPYDTSASFDIGQNSIEEVDCSCPYDYGGACKHMIALTVAFFNIYNDVATRMPIDNTDDTDDPKMLFCQRLAAWRDDELVYDVATQYSLIVESEYVTSVRIVKNTDYHNGHYYYDNGADDVLRAERGNLTHPQKTLLNALKNNSWQRRVKSMAKIFTYARDAGIPIYKNKRTKKNSMHFVDNPSRIPLTVSLGTHPQPMYGDDEQAIIVDAHALLSDKELDKDIFFDDSRIVVIDGAGIHVHTVSARLSAPIRRIAEAISREKYHYYDRVILDELYRVTLESKEVLRINNFIVDLYKHCTVSGDLSKHYTKKRFTKATPAFVIDYDKSAQTLCIQPVIDYGARMIDVSRTIISGTRGGRFGYRRRRRGNNKDALIEKILWHIGGETIAYAHIQQKKEKEFYRFLYENGQYGFTKRLKCERKGEDAIFAFLDEHWAALTSLGYPLHFVHDTIIFREESFRADVRADSNADNDWLAFDAEFYCGSDKVSLEDLKRYVADKKNFLHMDDGRILKITNREELERFVMLLEYFHEVNGRYEGRMYHAPAIENMFTNSDYYDAQFSGGLKKFLLEARRGRPVRAVPKTKYIRQTLRDYQADGVDWLHFLRKYHFGGILADDMGLGKTLQALTMVMMHIKTSDAPSLIVCPKTLLYNWREEAEKFFPALRTLVLDGTPKERRDKMKKIDMYDLIVTSYATLQRDVAVYKKAKRTFHYCFLDEAQSIKNYRTKNARTVKEIDAQYRVALTGTPLENSVAEIWSAFDFLMPGFLGSYKQFVHCYEKPIMKSGDMQALTDLRAKIKCFMLRRTKQHVLAELPEKVVQESRCHLGTDQNVLYQEVLANVKSEVFGAVQEKGFANAHIHILAGLTKLRQVCNHPALLLKDASHEKYTSAKLEMFLELVEEITSASRKVLVFSQFTSMLEILEKELVRRKIAYALLTGKTKKRQDVVKDFNEGDEKQVFLISLKAGGMGLNLTAADNVIIFDPWWNPSVEQQAIDRTHRIGQKNTVNVYRLITTGTIEEKIIALQKKKQFLFDNVIGESDDLFKKLTWDDIKALFE